MKNFLLLVLSLLVGFELCSAEPSSSPTPPVYAAVHSVAFSPNGKLVASGDLEGIVKLWDAKTGEVLQTVGKYRFMINDLAFSPDGKMLAIGRYTEIHLVNLEKNTVEHTIKHGVASIAFSSDGKTLASGNWGIYGSARDRSVCLWNVKTGVLRAVLKGHHNTVQSVNYSPDGTQLVSADKGGVIKVWDARTNVPLLTRPSRQEHEGASAMFTSEGTLLAVRSDNFNLAFTASSVDVSTQIRPLLKTIEVWDVHKDTLLQTFNAPERGARSIAVSPDGTLLASGSYQEAVKLWSIKTGEMTKELEAPGQGAFSLAFSPDGKQLAAGFQGTESVKIWPTQRTA